MSLLSNQIQVHNALLDSCHICAGTAVFVLNTGGKSEVWSSPMASPKGGAHGGYASLGPLAVSASSVYGMGQPMPMPMSMPMQQAYAQPQQVQYQILLLMLLCVTLGAATTDHVGCQKQDSQHQQCLNGLFCLRATRYTQSRLTVACLPSKTIPLNHPPHTAFCLRGGGLSHMAPEATCKQIRAHMLLKDTVRCTQL